MSKRSVGWWKVGFAALTVALVGAPALPASADIIQDTTITVLGQGFGANPRLLTVQLSGSNETTPPGPGAESGCVGATGVAGATQCRGVDASIQGNTVVSAGGQEASTGQDNKANSAVLAASLITTAGDIVIVYNPSQQGADPGTTITDLTIKFYSATNVFTTSVDNGPALVFADTGVNLGNGGVGFALVLDATQAALVNAACGNDFVTTCAKIALEATITNANDGPDSFTLFGRAAVAEPSLLALLGSGIAGLAFLARRRR